MGRKRLSGHPFGQTVISRHETGSSIKLAFQHQSFTAQLRENIVTDTPGIAAIYQISQRSGGSSKPETTEKTRAKGVIASIGNLRIP